MKKHIALLVSAFCVALCLTAGSPQDTHVAGFTADSIAQQAVIPNTAKIANTFEFRFVPCDEVNLTAIEGCAQGDVITPNDEGRLGAYVPDEDSWRIARTSLIESAPGLAADQPSSVAWRMPAPDNPGVIEGRAQTTVPIDVGLKFWRRPADNV